MCVGLSLYITIKAYKATSSISHQPWHSFTHQCKWPVNHLPQLSTFCKSPCIHNRNINMHEATCADSFHYIPLLTLSIWIYMHCDVLSITIPCMQLLWPHMHLKTTVCILFCILQVFYFAGMACLRWSFLLKQVDDKTKVHKPTEKIMNVCVNPVFLTCVVQCMPTVTYCVIKDGCLLDIHKCVLTKTT